METAPNNTHILYEDGGYNLKLGYANCLVLINRGFHFLGEVGLFFFLSLKQPFKDPSTLYNCITLMVTSHTSQEP